MALLRRIRARCARFAVPRGRPRLRPLLADAAITVAVGVVTAIMIHEAAEQGSRPPDTEAYALGVLMVLPIALQRRRPLAAMLVSTGLLLAYYAEDYPGIAPTAVLAVPLYTAVLSGRLVWSVGLCLPFFAGGYVIVVGEGTPALNALAEFLPHLALAAVVILLAEVVRSRRALTEETRERLRLAEADRAKDAARKVAEERVRIARELHDTVAHSMATITVQAASALHVLDDGSAQVRTVRTALVAIRGASKQALQEIGDVLGVLREGGGPEPGAAGGLDRLPALLDAVRAAGVPVTLEVRGRAVPLEPAADHSAYRILQESLTNVLRHAGPDVRAAVRISYDDGGVALEITDDGAGTPSAVAGDAGPPPLASGGGAGRGLAGMRERAEAAGGAFTAGPGPGGGFVVRARMPVVTP